MAGPVAFLGIVGDGVSLGIPDDSQFEKMTHRHDTPDGDTPSDQGV